MIGGFDFSMVKVIKTEVKMSKLFLKWVIYIGAYLGKGTYWQFFMP